MRKIGVDVVDAVFSQTPFFQDNPGKPAQER